MDETTKTEAPWVDVVRDWPLILSTFAGAKLLNDGDLDYLVTALTGEAYWRNAMRHEEHPRI
jgi:hypothetical protein